MVGITRRNLLSAVGFPAVLKAEPARPSLIVVLTDDQGYGDLSLHGNPDLRTPNIDFIANSGAQLTQFHVSPVCSPTRASLMTGRWNYRTGVVDTYLGRSMMYPDEVTVAEVLSKAGYRTGIFGKWHLGDNYPLRAMDQGFAKSLVVQGGGLAQPAGPQGNGYFDPVLLEQGKAVRKKGYCTDIFFDAALEFMETHRKEPFFAYITPNAPHDPLQVDESWVAPYRKPTLDDGTAKVYGMVANIDKNVGRLLERLRTLELEQNTLLVFLTDNGPAHRRFNAGMRGLKGSVYQGGIRVPCFVRWPGRVPAGRRIERTAAHIDWFPTILEACGISPQQDRITDGRSLVPLLAGSDEAWGDRKLFFQWHRGDVPEPGRACAVRSQRYKLVNLKELYDLESDPTEASDIAGAHPEQVAILRESYGAWFRDVSRARGFDPPRIHVGSDHENPVTLTRQDWRGPRAGWDDDSLGYWEVDVERGGHFRVGFEFPPLRASATAVFKLDSMVTSGKVVAGASTTAFNQLELAPGPARLEAWLAAGGESKGIHYIHLQRNS
jgi:arylsulfatase A-like enzyme